MQETICEMINYHNETLDKLNDFACTLCDIYSDIDDTPANDKYFELFGKLREEGIFLCCEANQYDSHWMMTEDGYVVTDNMMTEAEADEYKAYHWMYKENN